MHIYILLSIYICFIDPPTSVEKHCSKNRSPPLLEAQRDLDN